VQVGYSSGPIAGDYAVYRCLNSGAVFNKRIAEILTKKPLTAGGQEHRVRRKGSSAGIA
jgi:hypothetical protein